MQCKALSGAVSDRHEREADALADRVVRGPAPGPAPAGAVRGLEGGGFRPAPRALDAVRSSGRPLDAPTRGFMESRFGHDFSAVRVHTDAAAAAAAHETGAHAFTIGRDIVFASGAFAPATAAGKMLLAHELAHTIQQRAGGAAGAVLQKADPNTPDEKAKAIIAAAQDTTKPIEQRAVAAVKSIVQTYWDATKLDSVVWDEKEPGLSTEPVGTGKDLKGKIYVGKNFIDSVPSAFARKVLQVGHEMQHVDQQRAGMGGPAKKAEREFLAFHWEATQPEVAATGRMSHVTRVALIDGALGNYYCMPEADQKKYADKKQELLTLRDTESKKGGNKPTDPPASCKPSK
jgi:hypothetical protein